MPSDSGRTTSSWMATSGTPTLPLLTSDTRADVCVVGGGIAGLSTAYMLSREAKNVIVLDDGPIGSGETGRTTAHLSNAIDDRYVEIEHLHGEKGSRLAAESHSAAIDKIESIVREENIDCDFERLDGYLFTPPGESSDILEKELAAAHRAGLEGVEFVDRAPISGFDTGRCLRFPRQGQFHPLKYINALAAAIERNGGRVYAKTRVSKIQGGTPAHVTTESGLTVTADSVVVATNSPVNDMVAIHTKQAPYRTYVIGARVPRGTIFTALYWDTADPYHYVRLQHVKAADQSGVHDVLIVGGEDHKTGQADDMEQRFDRLEAWVRERFPMIEAIDFRWSGQVMEPVDGLAFIGRNPMDSPNVYIVTGDSGQGMTHGTIAGMLLTDLIQGRENPWATLYNPSRISLRSAKDFATENLNVAVRYGEWLTGGDVSSYDEIGAGSGAVVRSGLKKVAAYRDDAGTLHKFSASCPHLGCIVHWNTTEKSWDCPCHGSRFGATGQVVNGPSIHGLSPIEG